MNHGRHGAGRSARLSSAAVSAVLITVSCAGGDDGVPTAAAAPEPSAAPTPGPVEPPPVTSLPLPVPSERPSAAPVLVPTEPPSRPAVEAPDSSFTHQSIVVVIPDDAASPGPAMSVTAPAPQVPAGPTASAVPFVVADSIDTTDKRLNVSLGGETIYIRNGGRINMGDGLAVEVYIDPYPPTTLHSILDVYVTRDDEPVPGISVDVEFDMLSMLHGPFNATARDIGGGHHLATLDYIMFGAWDQFVTIRLGLDRIRFPVVIVAYP